MAEIAAGYKERGNEFFKNGQFLQAAELYTKAEHSDPTDPVYPSNLSAALFEAGDYSACVDATLRAWVLFRDCTDGQEALAVKLSTRLAKALCLGVSAKTISLVKLQAKENDITSLRELRLGGALVASKTAANAELLRAWQDWALVESVAAASTDSRRDECLNDFARMPHFSQPLDEGILYFTIGMDRIIDLTKGRHALGTLVGLSQAFKRLPSPRQSVFIAHLTLLDVQPATIARNLCMFMLLHELNETNDSVARVEIKATLMYTFLAVVMPSYCYDRFMSLARTLQERLSASPPQLPSWLHLDADSIPAVKRALAYWINTHKDTRRVLSHHAHTDPRGQQETADLWLGGGADGPYHKQLCDGLSESNRMYEMALRTLPVSTLMDLPSMPHGLSEHQARAFVDANMGMYVRLLRREAEVGASNERREVTWYKMSKVFLPPVALRKRHPGFEAAWRQLKKSGTVEQATRRQVVEHVNNDWKANITFYNASYNNPKYELDGDGYRTMEFGMFDSVDFLSDFCRKGKPAANGGADELTWDVASTFFDQVADALRILSGRVAVELISGGLSQVLARTNYGSSSGTPDVCPRKYMRMWHSNVPDYTNGLLNLAIYVLPSLDEDAQAGTACNCMLSRGVWESDEDHFTTYSFLLPKDVRRFLGCRVIRSEAVMDTLVLGPLTLPRPLDELATRDELTTWLTRILFNTFISGRARAPPYGVRLPHNLVAFFALLLHLQRVGFPSHWLSNFLARILSGSMMSDIAPYTALWPIPADYLHQRRPARRVRTDPWLVEFETIIATTYYAIPFPVASALPEGFSRDPDDVQVWEVEVVPTFPWSVAIMGADSPFEPVTRLLFYDPARGTARAIIRGLGEAFEWRAGAHAPGTFFVLTVQESVDYHESVSFRLSKRRMERLQEEHWEMVVYRHDTGEEATRPVFVTSCRAK